MDRYACRQKQFEEAGSALELDRLFARWREEDIEDARAKRADVRRLDDMQRRLVRLERTMAAMPAATGQAIGKHVRQVLDQRPELAYRGTWSAEENYVQSSLATYDGGMWLAIGTPTRGRRPKVDPSWRLVVKSAPDGGFA
jgi:hypothetical protein